MNRRHFIQLTAAVYPAMLAIDAKALALLPALYAMAGAVITATGLFMAWKISKCQKHQNAAAVPPEPPAPDDPPIWLPIIPIPGPFGMSRAPANAPSVDSSQVVISDVTALGMRMPDETPLTHYVQFVIQSSNDGVKWYDESDVEIWAGTKQIVVRQDGEVMLARNLNSICLETVWPPMRYYRLFPGALAE